MWFWYLISCLPSSRWWNHPFSTFSLLAERFPQGLSVEWKLFRVFIESYWRKYWLSNSFWRYDTSGSINNLTLKVSGTWKTKCECIKYTYIFYCNKNHCVLESSWNQKSYHLPSLRSYCCFSKAFEFIKVPSATFKITFQLSRKFFNSQKLQSAIFKIIF